MGSAVRCCLLSNMSGYGLNGKPNNGWELIWVSWWCILCSCFANVVLQCLNYTQPLTAYFLEGRHGESCKFFLWFGGALNFASHNFGFVTFQDCTLTVAWCRQCFIFQALDFTSFKVCCCCTTGTRRDWCFMCELQKHVQKVRRSQSPFAPINILSRIQKIGSHLGYGRQEDAHEFMR